MSRDTTRMFSGDVPERGYVVDKIHDFKVVVKDSSRSVEDRRVALRFLVHFVEDLHMPMHVGDNNDKGGNRTQVRFFDRGTNMHSLWDSGMIEYICDTEDFWLKDLAALDTPPARAAAMKGTIEDWATESLLAARQAYLGPRDGQAPQVRAETGGCVPRRESAGCAPTAVPGERAVGDGAQPDVAATVAGFRGAVTTSDCSIRLEFRFFDLIEGQFLGDGAA